MKNVELRAISYAARELVEIAPQIGAALRAGDSEAVGLAVGRVLGIAIERAFRIAVEAAEAESTGTVRTRPAPPAPKSPTLTMERLSETTTILALLAEVAKTPPDVLDKNAAMLIALTTDTQRQAKVILGALPEWCADVIAGRVTA